MDVLIYTSTYEMANVEQNQNLNRQSRNVNSKNILSAAVACSPHVK